ncbi:MAG: 30S ribosomal protein S27e [Thermoplasmatales archaeon]|nr:30S ribosomal protein S27e [Thermoplasmatales archaeon]MCW6170539.1 30S ribosomal protein S27e [Thermoplasmatales archaeon]
MEERKFVKPKNMKNKFIKIKCKDCGNEQITYSRITSVVVCNICGATLAKPTGGVLELYAEIVPDHTAQAQ